jgi:hypothetical protein
MDSLNIEKTIVFCVLGETVTSEFLRCWTEIVGYCLMNKIKPVLATAKTNAFNSKMSVLSVNGEVNAPFGGKLDYDYIIYVAKDFLPSLALVVELIKQDLDIVSCLSTNERSLKHTNYIENFDLNSTSGASQEYCKFEEIQDMMKTIKEYETNIRDASGNLKEDIESIEKPSSLVKVNYVDFSVICIKKGVFEKLQMPWFNYDGKTNSISGDVYFCNKCKEAGVDIHVDLRLIASCEKVVIC